MKPYMWLLVFFGLCFGQNSQSTVTFNLNSKFNSDQLNFLAVSDLDVFGRGNGQVLFTIENLHYNGVGNNSVVFTFEFWRNGKLSISATTNPIRNFRTGPDITMTNLDLVNSSSFSINYESASGRILPKKITINRVTEHDKFASGATASGVFPTGEYRLVFRATSLGGSHLFFEDEQTYFLESSYIIEPISPSEGESVSIPNPRFEWSSQNRFQRYKFLLYRLNEGAVSADEILSGTPLYETEVPTNNTSLTYPTSARSLEEGETYAWVVKGIIQTVAGENEIDMTLQRFTYDKPGTDPSKAALAQILREKFSDIEDQLKGYNLDQIRINGKTVDINELRRFMRETMRSGNKTIEIELN